MYRLMGTFTLAYITFALTRGGIYMGTFNVKVIFGFFQIQIQIWQIFLVAK